MRLFAGLVFVLVGGALTVPFSDVEGVAPAEPEEVCWPRVAGGATINSPQSPSVNRATGKTRTWIRRLVVLAIFLAPEPIVGFFHLYWITIHPLKNYNIILVYIAGKRRRVKDYPLNF